MAADDTTGGTRGGAGVPESDLPPGSVGRVDGWTVVTRRDGRRTALGRRCRHQLADLSAGSLDRDGCLVCPWHGARYDTDTGEMVGGPRGFLAYRGPTPVYSGFVKAYARFLRLATAPVQVVAGRVRVGRPR